MARKVNPKIFRIPFTRDWESKWFANKHEFKDFLKNDLQIRKFLSLKLKNCGISSIKIERLLNSIKIIIHTSKPGIIIGRGGTGIQKIRKQIKDKFLKENQSIELNIVEEKSPMLSANIILEEAISAIEKRLPYRRVMKKIIRDVSTAGAKGVKIIIKGRLNGAQIARSEKLIWGQLPLQKMRADMDYSRGAAHTVFGVIGIKVWIYKGQQFKKEKAD
ncbi:30S ribosomal protein S3 [Patescibacteria group bacterium]|nr:30S ribosomal protein S3 [Patescibacteria group bacterium]